MSPASIKLLLGLVYLGTDGDKKGRQILGEKLGLSGNHAQSKKQLEIQAKQFNLKGTVKLSYGNIIYVNPRFSPLGQEWMNDVTAEPFGALAVSKSPDESAKDMSVFVEEKTNNLIKDFIKPDDLSDPDLVTMLVNALYFKGDWTQKFYSGKTIDSEFMTFSGGKSVVKKVATMNMDSGNEFGPAPDCEPSRTLFSYLATNEAEILELPFEPNVKNGRPEATMIFVLPKSKSPDALDQLIKNQASKVNFWTTFEKSSRINKHNMIKISIPRFEFSSEKMDLKKVAQHADVGLKDFLTSPGVQKIHPEIDSVGQFFQMTAVKVNEDGGEAAAATAIGLMSRSASPAPPPEAQFIADRPFLYAIKITSSGELAFIGTVKDPKFDLEKSPLKPDARKACYEKK